MNAIKMFYIHWKELPTQDMLHIAFKSLTLFVCQLPYQISKLQPTLGCFVCAVCVHYIDLQSFCLTEYLEMSINCMHAMQIGSSPFKLFDNLHIWTWLQLYNGHNKHRQREIEPETESESEPESGSERLWRKNKRKR